MKVKKLSKRILASFIAVMLAIGCFIIPTMVAGAAGEITVNIHYLREDGVYDDWDVWSWTDSGAVPEGEKTDEGAFVFDKTNPDENGIVCHLTLTEAASRLGFIVRKPGWLVKDYEDDLFIDLSDVLSGTVEVYYKSGNPDFVTNKDNAVTGLTLKSAKAVDHTTVEIEFTKIPEEEITKDNFTIVSAGGQNIEISDIEMSDAKGTIQLATELDYFSEYTMTFTGNDGTSTLSVSMPDYFSSEEFESQYTYNGDDLGATYSSDSTAFRVWAPTAQKMELNIYDEGNGGTASNVVEMTSDVNGTWVATVEGDLNKKYYTYTAYFEGKTNKDIVDPYAKSVGVNGLRGQILDMTSTNPENWDSDNRHTYENMTDMEIYEVHIRDFSIAENSGIQNKGKYLAFTERGTTTPDGVKTGVDHLTDLGVTSVHILPSYDFGSVDETKDGYNWGYDPVNYNAPEGSYSTDPYHGEVRVNEYKQMVQGLHDADIGVIMDVVYNHTQTTDYCFNQLVPGYFYRPDSNGSGCGNDVASERSMVSKFIIDSVKYWASEYHLDGFRFDLMGLIDVDTMNGVRAALDEIDPTIAIYGEGWTLATSITKDIPLATQTNAKLTPGIAYFSDNIRDDIKGNVFDAEQKGYVNGDISFRNSILESIKSAMSWAPSPSQVINYADCHDNYTLWDEIRTSSPEDTLEDQIRQNNLGAAIVHTAMGTPFMMSGEEFLRTKTKDDGTFDHNSYSSGDAVNELDYSLVAQNQEVYDYYKGLISFRKAHPALRLSTADEVSSNLQVLEDTEEGVIAFTLSGNVEGETADQILVVYNPLRTATNVQLPDGDWNVYVNDTTAGASEIIETVSGEVSVPQISAMILVDEGEADEPGTDEPGTDEPEENSIIDDVTGVKVEGAIPEGVSLSVSEIEVDPETDPDVVAAYDINLLDSDNVAVQPDGTIKIYLPCDISGCKVMWLKDDGSKVDMNAEYVDGFYVFETDHLSIYQIVKTDASEPDTDEPGTDEPDTDEPGTNEPDTDEPGTDEPGTNEPGNDGTDVNPGTNNDDNNNTPSGNDGNVNNADVPTTGDAATMMCVIFAVVAFAAGAYIMIACKRKKREN